MNNHKKRSRNRVKKYNEAISSSGTTVTGRKQRNKRKNHVINAKHIGIICLITLLLAIALLFSLINLWLYITESKTDPTEPYPVKGVDVSVYQKEINWRGLEKEDIKFAFIKATEGSTYIDGRFSYNWNEASKTDIKIGAYHFMSYDTPGETQAKNFIKTVDKKWGMLPPVVDVEFYGKYLEKHPSRALMKEILSIILDKLENHYGRKPIIYTNTYIYNTYISGEYDDYPIWISDPDIPDRLSDGRDWLFCQYTFKAVSENIADGRKYVDMNVFNGNEWQFRKYNGK